MPHYRILIGGVEVKSEGRVYGVGEIVELPEDYAAGLLGTAVPFVALVPAPNTPEAARAGTDQAHMETPAQAETADPAPTDGRAQRRSAK